MQHKTLKRWSSCYALLLLSSSMHSVYLVSLKAVLLKISFQMWGWIWGRWNQHNSFLHVLEIWQIASSKNIFLLSCCFLVNTDASFKEIYLCDGKREAQIISETLFSMWLKIEDTKFTAVSHPWRVKPQLDVIFQLMIGSGSISHKWDYLQCNSV